MSSNKKVAPGLVLALALTQVGCGGSSDSDAGRQSPDKAGQVVAIEQSAIPARYAAPLPGSATGMQAWLQGNPAIAPVSHVVDSILQGNPQWLTRFSAAANAVPDADALAWARTWHSLFQYQDVSPSFCAQARTMMSGPPGTARTAISAPFARACATDDDASIVLRADTPNGAVIEFFDPWNQYDGTEKRRPFDPRLVVAVREAILADMQGDARKAAFTLVSQRDARADAALLAIHAQIKDQPRADDVAMAFFDSSSTEGKARAAAACKRKSNDPMCRADRIADEPSPARAGQIPVAAVKARVDQLSAMGFRKVAAVNIAEMDSDAAEVLLLEAGQAHGFDVETGQYPNQHDSLLRRLASLVAPDLDDAVFEEQAPEIEDESNPYKLLAYAGGKLYRTQAQNLGDWYDVDAVLRLLNAVMKDRNSDTRFTNLATRDQTLIVVAAPPEALAKAAKEGLLELGEASEATRVGKEFEEKVLRTLKD